jgi:lysophospholipase L1-like esterase
LAATHTEVWLLSEALSAGRSPAQRAALLARDGFHYSEAGHSAAAAWLDPLIRARLKSRAERRGSAR